MPESNFDQLLHRYLNNELTPEEHAKFSAWLDLLEKESGRDLEMSSDAREELFQRISTNVGATGEVEKLHPGRPATRRLLEYRWVQIAATLLLMLLVTFAVRQFTRESQEKAYANEKVILSDGTIVWISQSDNFRYYEKDGARFASFSGEALFEVAKNPNSPFTISCNGVNVRVVGTSFVLKADSAKIELNVLTGKVRVTSQSDSVGVDVRPNEKIVYSTSGILERTSILVAEIESLTANSEYNMKFQGASMESIIESIAKKFDVTVVVDDENLKRCHVSADFTDHSLEDTLSILADLLEMSYQINGTQVELSGRGC